MTPVHIVNRVFRGSLAKPIDLEILSSNLTLDFEKESVRHYKHRPHMLCIKRKGAALNIFHTGRFRIMGGYFKTGGEALNWLLRLTGGKLILRERNLFLQTQTVQFKVSPNCAELVLKNYPNAIFYEPELFTAMKLLRWTDVHVNLFFTGNVIILGRQSYDRALEVQQWLHLIERQPVLTVPPPPTSKPSVSSAYVEAVETLSSFIPTHLREVGMKYFYTYPPKLIYSWLTRMKTEKETLIPHLCRNIARTGF